MDARSEFTLNHAFVLKPDDVTKMWRRLQERGCLVIAEAECADGITRVFTEMQELCEYENARDKRILRLSLLAESEDLKKTACVSFSEKRFSPIYVAMTGPEAYVLKLRTELGDIVDGTRAWYSYASKVPPSVSMKTLGQVVAGVAAIMILDYAMSERYSSPPLTVVGETIRWDMKVSPVPFVRLLNQNRILVGGIILGVCSLGILLSARLFPVASFTIGQGGQRYKTADMYRKIGALGLFFSILGSVVAAWILR